ncbi:DUF397 domain-containing protein [Nonomuraea candida]|uniref:DUF397 domain-containing protein n=1 Tax=Nonomuraea candida TaxID=359159 RepID=UPI0005BBFF9A|nr:DUF397 domain-containing protein [Nonomuraea candida]
MDLYARDLGQLEFRRLCGGNNNEDGEGESCVEIAPIPGAGDAFALRDSKRPDAGTLRFTRSELEAFQSATI